MVYFGYTGLAYDYKQLPRNITLKKDCVVRLKRAEVVNLHVNVILHFNLRKFRQETFRQENWDFEVITSGIDLSVTRYYSRKRSSVKIRR